MSRLNMNWRPMLAVVVGCGLVGGGALSAQFEAVDAAPTARERLLKLLNAGKRVEEDGCARARAAMAKVAPLDGLSLLPPPGEEPLDFVSETDVLHYSLDIEVDLVGKWIGGSNVMTVRVVEPAVSTFEIRVSDAFALPALAVNGNAVSYSRTDSATIEVTLDRTYGVGEEFDLYIEYAGNPKNGGFGSIEFTTHNGHPIAWTLSEAWYAYTWWPAKDVNTDKATADLRFTVPTDFAVASQGLLQSITDLGNGKHQYHWKTDYQTATYLFSFAITNYTEFSDSFVYDNYTMPVDFFIFAEDDNSNNRALLGKLVPMLGVMSDLYGIYPFVNEKYGIAQFEWGGGMEHQTITSQSSFSEWLSAHELGHSWFGDMITCATWHDIWLNEGFATYSEALWMEFRNGQNQGALHSYMDGRRPRSVNGSCYVYDISSMNRIFSGDFSYRKPAWVLHGLRHVVGDDVFFDIIAAYRAKYEYGSAITDELIAVAEDVWGDDLNWFFDTWIYGIGAPEYRYAWEQNTVNGRTFVEVYLQQTQSGSYPNFPMPMDVVTRVGSAETLQVVWNDEDAEHLLFEVAEPIDGLTLDPDEWILETGKSVGTFVEGPPKIVGIRPIVNGKGNTVRVTIDFHKDVIVEAGDCSLVGDKTGPVNLTVDYRADVRCAYLLFDGALPTDSYVLVIGDSIVDVNSGQALDGELDAFRWGDTGVLPSGNGLAGGAAVLRFNAVLTKPGQGNKDRRVDALSAGRP